VGSVSEDRGLFVRQRTRVLLKSSGIPDTQVGQGGGGIKQFFSNILIIHCPI